MSNSPLVQYTRISPNSNNPRRDKIRKITIHHTACVVSVERLGEIFAPTSRQASSNYGVGSDGRIGMYVEEANRAWTSSSGANDHQAVTIEVSNSANGGDWPVSDYVLERTIQLCVDICQRNGIERLNFTGDANGNLTMHRYFANTSCPGPYLGSKFSYIADEVNRRLHPPVVSTPLKFGEGNKVIFNGTLYYNPQGEKPGQSRSNFVCTITKVTKSGDIAPYNINNGLGWVREQDLQLYVEPTPTPTPEPTPVEPPKEEPPVIEPPVVVPEPVEDGNNNDNTNTPSIPETSPEQDTAKSGMNIINIIIQTIIKIIGIIFKGGK